MTSLHEVSYLIHDLLAKYDIRSEDVDIVFRCKSSKVRFNLEKSIRLNWSKTDLPPTFGNSFLINGVKIILSDYDKK